MYIVQVEFIKTAWTRTRDKAFAILKAQAVTATLPQQCHIFTLELVQGATSAASGHCIIVALRPDAFNECERKVVARSPTVAPMTHATNEGPTDSPNSQLRRDRARSTNLVPVAAVTMPLRKSVEMEEKVVGHLQVPNG
jgi:hypothetical protein